MSGNKIKIKAPRFLDDPIGGRGLMGFFVYPFAEFIIIGDDKLTYRKRSFNLEAIEKLLLVKTKVTPWTHDHKYDPYGVLGTAMELYLVDNNGQKRVLIPKFIMSVHNWGLKRWNRFLSELSSSTGLPIEEKIESKKGIS